jgi:hypothetical protein
MTASPSTLDSDDKFMRHLAQLVRSGPGTVRLSGDDTDAYVASRFASAR